MAASRKASAFSWADEVEKEEEEAQAQLLKPQKPNPFGLARPREIVLEEKGIDWRKLDERLQSSNLRKEKLKENVPVAIPSVNGHERFPARSRSVERNAAQIENGRDVFHQVTPSVVQLSQPKQNMRLFVPPLKYPPRNLMGLIEDMQRSEYSTRFIERQHLHQHESERETKNENYNHIRRYFAVEEFSGHPIEPAYNEAVTTRESEMENMGYEFRRDYNGNRLSGPPVEPQADGRMALLDVEMDRTIFRREFDGGIRYAVIEVSDWENINGGIGRRGHLNPNMEDEGFARNYKERNAIKQGYYQENVNDGFARKSHPNTKGKKDGSRRNCKDNIGRGCRNRNSDVEDMACPSMGVRVLRDLNMDGGNFEQNYRKRGTASTAAELSCKNQRRR